MFSNGRFSSVFHFEASTFFSSKIHVGISEIWPEKHLCYELGDVNNSNYLSKVYDVEQGQSFLFDANFLNLV